MRALRHRAPLCVFLATLGSAEGRDFLTLRYHGRTTSRFELTQGWPEDATEVCATFPAVCVNLYLGQCVQAPPELRAAWTRNATERDAGRYIFDPPRETEPGGYLMLTNHDMKYETHTQDHLPIQIFGGCSEGCLDCARGTGLALHPVKLPYMCHATDEGGAFAVFYNPGDGSFDTEVSCVDSLEEYWAIVEERDDTMNVIRGLVGGGFTFSFAVAVAVIYWKHKTYRAELAAESLRALQEGRAHFTVVGGFFASGRTTITQAQIEGTFPVTSLDCEEQCVVCLEPISSERTARTLQCNHSFHADCILAWWVHRPRQAIECPVCKRVQQLPEEAPDASATAAEPSASDTDVSPQIVGAGAEADSRA